MQTLPVPVSLMSEEQVGTVTVRIDAELVRMARIICAHTQSRPGKNLKLVDYLDTLVRQPITSEYRRIMEEIAGSQDASTEKKGKKGS